MIIFIDFIYLIKKKLINTILYIFIFLKYLMLKIDLVFKPKMIKNNLNYYL